MRNRRVLAFPRRDLMISRREWSSFIKTRKMLDEVRKDLAFLEAEWEERRRSIQERLLAGAEIEGGGKVG
jgi:hypothetical protein